MKRVNLRVYIKKFDFEDYSLIELKRVKEYTFYNNDLSKRDVDYLFNTLMDIKYDQMEYEFCGDESNLYININLRYSNYEEVEKGESYPFLQEILSVIDEFVKNKRNINVYNEAKYPNEYVEEENGLLMTLDTHGLELLEKLQLQQVDFKHEVISEKVFRKESGSSDLVTGIIVYVSNIPDLIFAGAVYDITRWTLFKLISTLKDEDIRVVHSSKINYKRLRKQVSTRVKLKPDELTLKTMDKDNSGYIYEFKANNLEIVVICSEDGVIQEIDTKEK